MKNKLTCDSQILEESSEISCLTVIIDSSNYGSYKLWTIVIRYFHIKYGMNFKVMELKYCQERQLKN